MNKFLAENRLIEILKLIRTHFESNAKETEAVSKVFLDNRFYIDTVCCLKDYKKDKDNTEAQQCYKFVVNIYKGFNEIVTQKNDRYGIHSSDIERAVKIIMMYQFDEQTENAKLDNFADFMGVPY